MTAAPCRRGSRRWWRRRCSTDFRCNLAGNELEGWQGLPRLFKWCSATFPCVEGCAVKRFSTRKAVQARTRSKRGTPPPTGCPTATRGASAATTNDVQNTTARLSVRLSVHPLPTQRCPVIPIHAPHAWDTHWRQCGGVMDVYARDSPKMNVSIHSTLAPSLWFT